MFTHNLDPVLFDFGLIVIRWYSLAYIAGILIGWWLGKKIIVKRFESVNYKFDIKEFESTPYVAEGVSANVEKILEGIGKDVKLSRVGKSAWDVEEGSALIKISHNLNNRFI